MKLDPLTRNNVVVLGNPEAVKTIVFVNGLGYDQSFWRLVTPAFENDYRLVLFDNVGSVESNQAYFRENQFRYLNVNGYATDLYEICSALNLGRGTLLVGHSLGSMAGLLASIRWPSLFSRLVLIGASPRYADAADYQGGFSRKDIDAIYVALESNYQAWSEMIASAAMGAPDMPSLKRRFADSVARVPPEMMLTVLCSVLQMDHRADLAKVTVPTLLIQSQADYFVPLSVAEYMQAHIPCCQLKIIDAIGHLPHVSVPEKVVEAINEFIGQG